MTVIVVPVPMMPLGCGKLTKSGALPVWGVCSTTKQDKGRREGRKEGGRREERRRGREEYTLTADKGKEHPMGHRLHISTPLLTIGN